jgi:hypothetical protein
VNSTLVYTPVRTPQAPIFERPGIEELPRPKLDERAAGEVIEQVDDLLADVYGYAFLETGRRAEAERITNRAIARLGNGAVVTIDPATLRPRLLEFAEREVIAYRRSELKRKQLRAGRANLRHLVLAGSTAFAAVYAGLQIF